ncbi:MAG TPA: carboxypeptidase-like regulatory domain-containing protein [Terriglobales bacterium]|nr:carboxypeptidase-like regulatory domain-containing protein [Terriglobales bacterium]
MSQSSETDAKGEFKVKSVAPGSYALQAQQHSPDDANYHASQKIEVGSEGWYVKSVRLGANDLLANGLEVEKGEDGGTIQVVVANGGAELDGSVRQDGKPMIGARIRISPDAETRYNRLRARATNTDQSGRFSFIGIAPGQYLS